MKLITFLGKNILWLKSVTLKVVKLLGIPLADTTGFMILSLLKNCGIEKS